MGGLLVIGGFILVNRITWFPSAFFNRYVVGLFFEVRKYYKIFQCYEYS